MQNTKIISLTWENLSAHVQGKTVLNNCSGYCKPGEMLAIMGPSGAGKTTLLSLLSKRQSASLAIQGQVLANNQGFTAKEFFKFGCFVYQNDLLFQYLSVRETIEFAALLKISQRKLALERTDQLIEQFELQKCSNSYVGGAMMKGISGGQKKRLCVAIQMVSDPALIVLDQPTSGLDSNKAANLLSILKKLAKSNRTIIFTIHQPSYLQYVKLDRLVLLDKGETIYQGPASGIGDYMTSLNIQVSQTSTISDFFMMEISQYKRDKSNYETPLNYANYEKRLAQKNDYQIKMIKQEIASMSVFDDIYEPSFWFSFKMIFKRDCYNNFRGNWKITVHMIQIVTKIMLMGVLFINQMPSVLDVQNAGPKAIEVFIPAQYTTFNTIAGSIITAILSVALAIPAERQLYYKEVDSKKYRPLPYFLSKVLFQFILALISTCIFALSAYWMVGYTKDFSHFAFFFIVTVSSSFVGNGLGFFCATLFRDLDRVVPMTNIVNIPLLILSGIFNRLGSMPDWSSWLQYFSPFRYGTHLLLLNEYGDQTFGGTYDYRADLGINLSFINNLIVLLGLGFVYYIASFFLLKYYTVRIAP